jgi:hypothetical protein
VGLLLVRLLLDNIMKQIISLIIVLCLASNLFAKTIVVTHKESTVYNKNISDACERKMSHGNIEIVNHLKYIEVQKKGVVVASFDPVQVDRNSIYIWVELSPNGKMILFSTSDQGVFVCNLKGKILYRLGKGVHATNWWNNRYIVGMIDEDNGLDFTKSDLVMVDIKTTTKIPIATEEKIALYPCANKPYVDYFTMEGEKYTIKLTIKN